MRANRKMIGVIGGRKTEKHLLKEAEEVGRMIAEKGAVMVCGGLRGVMEAASRGARAAGGLTVGILPQEHKRDANQFIDIAIPTGLGIGRNAIIARTADALIAVGGEYGTLSEIAFALQMRKPVIGIGTWDIRGVIPAESASEAVGKAFGQLASGPEE
ncbi:MAG: TIGR00725 family protein [Candidatus Sulfobium sp.]|jgi:uncharacterized protein (TIGR00725 family)